MAENPSSVFCPNADLPPENPEPNKDYYEEYKSMFVKNLILLK